MKRNTLIKNCTLEAAVISAVEKVFPDKSLRDYRPLDGLSALRGERIQFQVICCDPGAYLNWVGVTIGGDLASYAKVRHLQWMPCLAPVNLDSDDPAILTRSAGLFPGPLMEVERTRLYRGKLTAFHVTLTLPADLPAKVYAVPVQVHYFNSDSERVGVISLKLSVIATTLPPQRLSCEMWFHTDCLMQHYGVDMRSRKFMAILRRYFTDMAEHGVNTLLTPLWTPPLDTKPGGERLTSQLLDITVVKGKYHFDFRRLKAWISLARECGITHFSFSHIFTQWGLAASPKILATVDGVEKRIFGWDTPSESAEYIDFLRQLFPALLNFMGKNGLTPENTRFHLSDEPAQCFLEKYESCSKLVHSLIGPYQTLDALSHVDFYDCGLVDIPIPATDAVEPFMERDIPHRWTYYCGNWANRVPNRKLGMTSVRNRVLGVLLWVYRMDGFLEWGYNFWATFYTQEYLNPWNFADLSQLFGGDGGAFAVFPGRDGAPVDTDYYEVFADGLQDMRALELLESKIGRERTLAIVNDGMPAPLDMHNWPDDAAWLLSLRERVNKAIQRHCTGKKAQTT